MEAVANWISANAETLVAGMGVAVVVVPLLIMAICKLRQGDTAGAMAAFRAILDALRKTKIKVLIIGLCVLWASGCSHLWTGMDARTASLAKHKFNWDANDALTMEDATTHTGCTLFIQGDANSITVTPGENGTPPTITGACGVFWRASNPEVVAGSYQHAIGETQQTQRETVSAIRDIVGDVVGLKKAEIEIKAKAESTNCEGPDCPLSPQ